MKQYALFWILFSGTMCSVFARQVNLQPAVWLRADYLQDRTTTWYDFSGNRRHGQLSEGFTITPGAPFNNSPSLLFTKPQDYVWIPYDISPYYRMTFVSVYRQQDPSRAYGIYNAYRGNTETYSVSTHELDSLSSSRHGIHSLLQNWGERMEETPGCGFFVGTGDTNTFAPYKGFQGELAEVLVFDRMLEDDERMVLETYLSLKYGIPLTKQDYILPNGDTVWHSDPTSDYFHYMAGIGTTIELGLYQKQSACVPEGNLLTIGVTRMNSNDPFDKSPLQDGSFLVWGNNGKALGFEDRLGKKFYKKPLLSRRWRMQVSQSQARTVSTSLQIDLAQITDNFGSCSLLISPDNDETFSKPIPADSISASGTAYFSNILWDKDSSGVDYFTFSLSPQLQIKTKPILCHGVDNGEVSVRVSGGTAPYTYILSDSFGTELSRTTLTTDSIRFSNLSPHRYHILVTDAEGISAMEQSTLEAPVPLYIDLPDNDTIHSTTGRITLTAHLLPATEKATFRWNKGHTHYATGHSISVTDAGTYTLRVETSPGCSVKDTVKVAYVIDPTISCRAQAPSCYGGSDGLITSSVVGGTGTYQYTLSDSLGNKTKTWKTTDLNERITGLRAGLYNVEVQDTKALSLRCRLRVEKAPRLYTSLPEEVHVHQKGTVVELDASINIQAEQATYRWSHSNGFTAASPKIAVRETGTYRVVIATPQGCRIEDSSRVVFSERLLVDARATDISCFHAQDGTIQVHIQQGVPPYIYLLSNASGKVIRRWVSHQQEETIKGLSAGTYQVLISASNGLKVHRLFSLADAPQLYLSLPGQVYLSEEQQQTRLEASLNIPTTDSLSYRWIVDDKHYSEQQAITITQPGRYCVAVTTPKGCVLNDTTQVTQILSPVKEPQPEPQPQPPITPLPPVEPSLVLSAWEVQLPQKSPATLSLYELSGKKLYDKTLSEANEHLLNLQLTPLQVYIVVVNTQQETYAVKMLSQTGTATVRLYVKEEIQNPTN